jgi:phosphatidylglycerol---prolipoprotein diacylglyceryl transferase
VHPNLLHLGFLTIPTYGALAAVGLMLALAFSLRTAHAAGVDPDAVWNAGLFALITAFVLSRLLLVATNLHTFFRYPILLLMVPSLTPLGLALTALATAIYLRTHATPVLATLDAWAPCVTLAWAFLALGHFAEGSDPGLPASLPWAIAPGLGLERQHPVAVYAALCALVLTVVLFVQLKRHGQTNGEALLDQRRPGDTAALGLALIGLAQFLLSFLREPSFSEGRFGNLLDPIQWLALGMIVAAALLWQWPRRGTAHAV